MLLHGGMGDNNFNSDPRSQLGAIYDVSCFLCFSQIDAYSTRVVQKASRRENDDKSSLPLQSLSMPLSAPEMYLK